MCAASDSLRILMISDFYPPIIGGLERHVQTQARELVHRGHQVAVATLWHEGQPEMEIDEGVQIYRVKGWNRALLRFYENEGRAFHPTLPDPGVMAGLRGVVRKHQPQLVHARGWMLYSFLPLKKYSGAKLVVTLHDYSLACVKKTYIRDNGDCDGPSYLKCVSCAAGQYGRVKSLALTSGLRTSAAMHGLVDQYVAIGRSVRDVSLSHAKGRPIAVISSFVPDATLVEAERARRPGFLPPDDNYILFVGALGRHKGLYTLLEAYEELNRRVPLVLLGTQQPDTPERFPEGVVVERDVPHGAVMGAWRHCLFGVAPSLWQEPFGQVAVEAMACGKAVVASGSGGLAEVVSDGETGILVPSGNADELRRAMVRLLEDGALRERMGAAGRKRAQLFTASVVTEAVESLYRDVLARPGGRITRHGDTVSDETVSRASA